MWTPSAALEPQCTPFLSVTRHGATTTGYIDSLRWRGRGRVEGLVGRPRVPASDADDPRTRGEDKPLPGSSDCELIGNDVEEAFTQRVVDAGHGADEGDCRGQIGEGRAPAAL